MKEGVEQVTTLLTEPGLRLSLGQQARRDAINQFSRQSFNERYRKMLFH
jgi:hypothetical protein